uniref:SRCR domain-containing protein n=1 Tax=Poecilia mexicana TaxID=48701 RepID=A0A3B3YCM5_9TELE
MVCSLIRKLLLTDSVIRLTGSTSCSGRVEINHNGQWGTICDDNWDLSDAQVVCRQLSCGSALSATSSVAFGLGTGQIWLDEVNCTGSESSLTDCQHPGFGTHNCGHNEDAGVVCSGEKSFISILRQKNNAEIVVGDGKTFRTLIQNQPKTHLTKKTCKSTQSVDITNTVFNVS